MLFATPVITAYVLVVTILLGLVMGSFLNCLAWRLTHNESVLRGRSHCTSCGHVLSARDLVPVFSWLFSHGRCRYCGERVSWRYPATEVLCAALYTSIVLRYGLTLEAVEMLLFASALLVLSLTDIDEFVIPNACVLFAVVVRLVYIVASCNDVAGTMLSSVGSGLVIGVVLVVLTLIMDRVLGKESMGGGDIKLLAVAGLYFGWAQCLFLLVVACVAGIVVGFVQLGSLPKDAAGAAGAKKEPGSAGGQPSDVPAKAFPWGPSIALACWITMLVGGQVLTWYTGLLA